MGETGTEETSLVLYNGRIHTMDGTGKTPEAVACVGDRIVAVGTTGDLEERVPSPDRSLNLEGRTVVPGFIDAHVHLGQLSLDLQKVQVHDVHSLSELQDAIARAAEETPAGEWIQSASDWHQNQLEEERFPTRWELDRATDDHPVILYRGAHNAVVNSEALRRAGIDEDAEDPEGGHFHRNEDGELTGWLQEDPAVEPVEELLPEPDPAEYREALGRGIQKLHSVGVTSIRDAQVRPRDLRVYQQLRSRNELTMRSTLCPFIAPENPVEEELDMWGSAGISTGWGDEWLRLGPLKMFADGGVETAMLKEEYANQPGYRGLAVTPEETVDTVLEWAGQHDWGVAVHAVGDRAVEQVLNRFRAHRSAFDRSGQPLCMEHGILMPPEKIADLMELDVRLTVQTGHLYTLGSAWVDYFGEERAHRLYPLRSLIDRGVKPAGGTDAPVTPYDTFVAMEVDVSRRTNTGEVLGDDQAITPREALMMHTRWAARATGEQSIKGTITPGKRADLAVLSDDPLTTEPDRLSDLECELTVAGGDVVYRAE